MSKNRQPALAAGAPSGGRGQAFASFRQGSWVLIFLVLETVYFCFRSRGLRQPQLPADAPLLRRAGLPPRRPPSSSSSSREASTSRWATSSASPRSSRSSSSRSSGAMGLDPGLSLLLGVAATLLVGLLPGLVNGWLVAYLEGPALHRDLLDARRLPRRLRAHHQRRLRHGPAQAGRRHRLRPPALHRAGRGGHASSRSP